MGTSARYPNEGTFKEHSQGTDTNTTVATHKHNSSYTGLSLDYSSDPQDVKRRANSHSVVHELICNIPKCDAPAIDIEDMGGMSLLSVASHVFPLP